MNWKRVEVTGKGMFKGNGVWEDASWIEYHLYDPDAELVLATCVKTGRPGVDNYPWVWWVAANNFSGRAGTLAEAKSAAEDARAIGVSF